MTVPIKNAVFIKYELSNAGVGLLLLCLATLFIVGFAFADDRTLDVLADAQESAAIEAALESEDENFSEENRVEVGMSLKDALELVGRTPDSEEEVGAACGMLDVFTWNDDGTKIISVDGTVTSIVEGNNDQP